MEKRRMFSDFFTWQNLLTASLGILCVMGTAAIYQWIEKPKIIWLGLIAVVGLEIYAANALVNYLEKQRASPTEPIHVKTPASGASTMPVAINAAEQRDQLCRALSEVFGISGSWLMHRWNKHSSGYSDKLNEPDWPQHLQLQYSAIKTIREIIHAGADRWISPTLGTPPGRWTTELLAILREVEPQLWVTSPREDISIFPDGYFEKVSKKLGVPADTIRKEFVSSRQKSETILTQSIGKLQKIALQLQDADISRFS